MKKNSNNCW